MPASLSSFLLSGSYWNGIEVTNKPVVVTYSFPLVAPAYDTIATDPNLTQTAINSFAGFNAAQQQLAVNAMNQWGTVLGTSDPAAEHASGIVFVQVAPGLGDVNFQTMNLTGTGYAGAGGVGFFPFGNWTFASSPYFFDDLDYSGDVVMNQAAAFDYATLIHEVGHAIGLKHPTETDTGASGVVHPGWDPATDPNLSIMSATGGTAQLPTALDRQAVQTIYGTLAQGQALVAASNWNAATSTLTPTRSPVPTE